MPNNLTVIGHFGMRSMHYFKVSIDSYIIKNVHKNHQSLEEK